MKIDIYDFCKLTVLICQMIVTLLRREALTLCTHNYQSDSEAKCGTILSLSKMNLIVGLVFYRFDTNSARENVTAAFLFIFFLWNYLASTVTRYISNNIPIIAYLAIGKTIAVSFWCYDADDALFVAFVQRSINKHFIDRRAKCRFETFLASYSITAKWFNLRPSQFGNLVGSRNFARSHRVWHVWSLTS